MFFAACLIRYLFSTNPIRTNPSPFFPKASSGATATSAFIIKSFENFIDPRFLNLYGIGAHTNILASGEGISQPILLKDFINKYYELIHNLNLFTPRI